MPTRRAASICADMRVFWVVVRCQNIKLPSADTHLAMAAPLAPSCTFSLSDGLQFDLCPLLNKRGTEINVTVEEETPPTLTTYRYTIGLNAPLKVDGTLPRELQCPVGTWICLVVLNTRPNHPSEPPRHVQVVQVAAEADLNPRAKLVEKLNSEDVHEILQITLHGGTYNGRSQTAAFWFHCDHEIEEPSFPNHLWRFNGTHAFAWSTPHACPLNLPPGAPTEDLPDDDPPAMPPPDPDTGKVPKAIPLSLTLTAVLIAACAIALTLRYLSRWGWRLFWLAVCPKRRQRRDGFRALVSNWEDERDLDASTPLTPTFKSSFGTYGSAVSA
ncbi:Autophagy-related protein 27 [Mycena kentingensis (nom. inval.)]|nr:Autophagy-related protein 27 [Mycena kentingensis (nom. inval.)]